MVPQQADLSVVSLAFSSSTGTAMAVGSGQKVEFSKKKVRKDELARIATHWHALARVATRWYALACMATRWHALAMNGQSLAPMASH
jgi:hypothetical protein